MGKQGRGRRLTDKERMEIIVITRENPRIKHVELAAKYGVNESTIRKWRGQTNASKIEERYTQGVAASRDQRQRGQAVRNAQFDGELYEWVVAMLKQDPDLPPVRIREKARALASLHEGMEGFKASSGWFYRFCRRYGLTFGGTERALREKLFAGGSLMTPSDAVPTVDDSSTTAMDTGDGAREELATSTAIAEGPLPAAIAASLQPPTVATTHLDGVDQADQVNASNGMLLNLGDFSSTSNAAGMSTVIFSSSNVGMTDGATASATSAADASTTGEQNSSSPPQVLTTTQVAVSHVLQHFKDLLDPPIRLRLVRHLSSVRGEAEMYLVMDDETRIEYIKDFVANNSSTV